MPSPINHGPSNHDDCAPLDGQDDRALRLLVVDNDPEVCTQVSQCLRGSQSVLIRARNLAEAEKCLSAGPVDLALIESDLPDGPGMRLAKELNNGRTPTQSILLTGQPSFEKAVQAMRVGVVDLLVKPLTPGELRQRVDRAINRQRLEHKRRSRVRKLRTICRELSSARDEVAKQVDILCNDLVTAYQDLADQMHQVVQTNEYSSLIGTDLDLESLLRRTLEYMLDKVGPTNAAVYLPANDEDYSLGGYVNYDCASDTVSELLQRLADVAAPTIADRDTLLHVTDDDSMSHLLGADAAYLIDRHLVAFPCVHEDESLAVVILFRDYRHPFTASSLEACVGIGPMLGNFLAKIVRIHNRHMPLMDEADGSYF